jgi:hypothetical protein
MLIARISRSVTFTPFGYLLASISQQTFGPVSVVVAPIS